MNPDKNRIKVQLSRPEPRLYMLAGKLIYMLAGKLKVVPRQAPPVNLNGY